MLKRLFAQADFRNGLIATGIMLLIALVYFKPVLSGETLQAFDLVQVTGMQKNLQDYRERTGEEAYWSTSMFGGMPVYTIGGRYKGSIASVFSYVANQLVGYPVLVFFFGMLFSFALLRSLKVHWLLALAGGVAYAFFSYHVILYEAGHVSKLRALMYAPAVLWGIILTYRGKLLLGGLITALAVGIELYANHVQMTYYLFFIILAYAIYRFARALKEKQLPQFGKASAVLVAAALLGIGINATKLLPLYEYSQYTIRGPNELSTPIEEIAGQKKADTLQVKKEAGLDRSYAFRWSNGRKELMTLLIPNFVGGKSTEKLEPGGAIQEKLKETDPSGQLFQQVMQSNRGKWNAYWGPQPFTSGPVYLGAVVIFLFIVGLMLVDTGFKWAILYAVLIGMILSLGSRSFTVIESLILLALPAAFIFLQDKVKFPKPALGVGLFVLGVFLMLFFGSENTSSYRITDFFFDYVPLYNRFRAPASMLVIVVMAAPWLAFKGGQKLLSKDVAPERKLQAIYWGGGLLAVLCLIFALLPGAFFDFQTDQELQAIRNAQNRAIPAVYNAFAAEREAMLSGDAWRSLALILLAGGLAWAYAKEKLTNLNLVAGGLAVLVAIDLVGVATRYVAWEDFVKKTAYEQNFQPRQADQFIKKIQDDSGKHFRVYPINRNPFNDGSTPYHLKSVGGYNAAKIRRFQQLADVHLLNTRNKNRFYKEALASQALTPYDLTPGVVNMLNMEYLITSAQFEGMKLPQYEAVGKTNEGEVIFRNRENYGPAWIVRDVRVKDKPDDVLRELYEIDTRTQALIEQDQADQLGEFSTDSIGPDESIKLTSFDNMEVKYSYSSPKDRFVVFSEVYYEKGWVARIDGQETPILQTNFVLRGIRVPKGDHEIVFTFEPQSVQTGALISYTSSVLVLLGFGFVVFLQWKRSKGQSEGVPEDDAKEESED